MRNIALLKIKQVFQNIFLIKISVFLSPIFAFEADARAAVEVVVGTKIVFLEDFKHCLAACAAKMFFLKYNCLSAAGLSAMMAG